MNSTSAVLPSSLKKAAVCKLLDISERTLENMVKTKKFPPPVFIGKHCYWSEKIIQQWHQRKFSAQENWYGAQ
jgi:predicted DNA-binding transcriptional regulator AlpA